MKMKFIKLAALSMLLAASPSFAEEAKEAKTPKVIVIDVQRIMADSDAAKNIRSQVEGYRKDIQADASKKETALRAEDQEIAKQQGKISQEEFTKKAKAFQEKFEGARKEVAERERNLGNAVNVASDKIEKELQKILFDLAKEKGATLVIPKQAVLVAENAMDFTDQVLEQLNKNLSKVPVTVEKSTPPAAAEKPAAEKPKK